MPLPVFAAAALTGLAAIVTKGVVMALAVGLVWFVADFEATMQAVMSWTLDKLLPDDFSFATSWLSSAGKWFAYSADLIQLWDGLKIVLGAYIARFAVRRLPFIG